MRGAGDARRPPWPCALLLGHITDGDFASGVGDMKNSRNSCPDPLFFLCFGFCCCCVSMWYPGEGVGSPQESMK